MRLPHLRRTIRAYRKRQPVTAAPRHAAAWTVAGVAKTAAPIALLLSGVVATSLFVTDTGAPHGGSAPPTKGATALRGGSTSPSAGAPAGPSAPGSSATTPADQAGAPLRSSAGSPGGGPSGSATAAPGSSSASTPTPSGPAPTPTPNPTPPPSHAAHVMVIMEENRGYAGTLGSCSADPYLCSLAATYASDVAWDGVSHPSMPNYIASITGSTQGCSSDTCFSPYGAPSLGGQLTAAGIPWTAYMESMPSACYTGQFSGGTLANALYAEKHDPFVVVNDVLNNGCAQHVLPYPGAGGLVSALDRSAPPDFVWITPNQQNDMHTGTVQAGDAWLQANLGPVLTSPWFTAGNATVIVTMDEDEGNNIGGGGPVPMVVLSSNARGVGSFATAGNHYGMLRSIERVFGLGLLGGAGNAANGDLSGRFGGPG